jgi:DNA polymerase-4
MWGIGPKREGVLRELGIQTCGDLGRFPGDILKRRFGSLGEKFHRMGLGIDETPVVPIGKQSDPKSFSHFVTLPEDTSDSRVISGFLLRLSEQVGRRLRRNSIQGRTVILKVRFSNFSTITRQHSSRGPLESGREIYPVALRIWDSIAEKRPVRLLGVVVSNLEKTSNQFPLYSSPNKMVDLWKAMDRVNDKYGDFTLTWGSLLLPPG